MDFGPNGWPPSSFFDQPELDAWLRAEAQSSPGAEVHLGHEVEGFADHGDHVRLDVRDCLSGSKSVFRARYLVACDGASSPVRQRLGVGWQDLGYDHEWLVVDIVLGERHTLGVETLQVCDPDRLTTYVATKDPFRRWEFKLNPGETREGMLAPSMIQSLIDDWTPRGTYEIRRAAVYQFHAATAAHWRSGRTFLAGDAAHQTPPFLGQGMNAGIRDVINLAWKLPLVLSQTVSPDLLESYQAERRAHAADMVEWAVAIGKLMEYLARVEDAERRGDGPLQESPPDQSSGYGQGREAPPLSAGVLIDEQVGNDVGATGYLFSQPIVRDTEGLEFRLDEKLGRGFAVVARTAAELALNEESRILAERLGISLISLEGLQGVRGRFDGALASSAVVVRPDRYVFGHTSPVLDLDALLARLAEQMPAP